MVPPDVAPRSKSIRQTRESPRRRVAAALLLALFPPLAAGVPRPAGALPEYTLVPGTLPPKAPPRTVPPPPPPHLSWTTEVFFHRDSAELLPIELRHLRDAAEVLRRNPSLSLVITGYAAIGENAARLDDGAVRVASVKAHLVAMGIAPERLVRGKRRGDIDRLNPERLFYPFATLEYR